LHRARVEAAGWPVERDKLDAEKLLLYRPRLLKSQGRTAAGRFFNGAARFVFVSAVTDVFKC
jgi:hypothetical protein